jgi:hypothetical protein
MTFLYLLLVLAAVLAATTVHALLHDDRPRRTPRSHVEDPLLRPPYQW